jgi:hypothetical protein
VVLLALGVLLPPAVVVGATGGAGATTHGSRTLVAAAKAQWQKGAASDAAGMGAFWVKAAKDLVQAAALRGSGHGAAATAARQLTQLASLPDTMDTPAQQAEALKDTLALNAYFDLDGLYGESAPSASVAAFRATLQHETRIGTLSSIPAERALPGATVTCPVLHALTAGSAFGCRVKAPSEATFLMVGELNTPRGSSYIAQIATSGSIADCRGLLDTAEQAALTQLGGTCD